MANIHTVIQNYKETEGTTISNKTNFNVSLLSCMLDFKGEPLFAAQERLAPGETRVYAPNFLASVFLVKNVPEHWTEKDLEYRLGKREEWEVREEGGRPILKKITPFTKWLDKTLNKNKKR